MEASARKSRETDLGGAFETLIDSILMLIEKSIPVRVERVYANRTRVDVTPLISVVGNDGQVLQRDQIKGLPVMTMGAGGMLMSFPIAAGDLGWIDTADRDISLFLQEYSAVEPPTGRFHSYSDARFIPDIMRNFTISDEDSTAIVIQNSAGTVKVAVDTDEVRIVNGSVNATVTSSTIDGIAPDGINLNGMTVMPGGVVTATNISASTSLSVNGTEMDNHIHGGVTRGDQNTDPV